MDAGGFGPIAALGEYFALPAADPTSWAPIASLCGAPDTLREYAMRTRAATASAFRVEPADIPVKAAASALHLSIAARLLSPAVGAAVCLGSVPLLAMDSLFWQDDSTHRPTLGTCGAVWVPVADAHRAAAVIAESLVGNVLRLLNDTMRRAVALPPPVMWGNVASAANGAVTVLAQSRPDLRPVGRDLVAALIATGLLRGTADVVGQRFRRRNCCLFYQVPGGGYCGDCVLTES